MRQRLKLIFAFYKPYWIISLLINFILASFGTDWLPALAVKGLFTGLIAWSIATTNRKNQLDFYRNLQMSPGLLVLGAFLLDTSLLFLTLYLFGIFGF